MDIKHAGKRSLKIIMRRQIHFTCLLELGDPLSEVGNTECKTVLHIKCICEVKQGCMLHCVVMFTSQPFHPGPLIYSQVVVYDLENVSKQSVHVFRGHRGAAVVSFVRVALWPMFPPVRHVAA